MHISFECPLLLLLVLLRIDLSHGTNVTFVPESTRITVASLPAPGATSSVSKGAIVDPVPEDPRIYVPEGFSVQLYMTGLTGPRYMIYTPSGDILVSESVANRTSCLIDSNGDGYPDQRVTFADASNGLNYPFGMTFFNGSFYVASRDALRRYAWTPGSRNISGTGEILMTYPSEGHRTRTVLISSSGNRLFVSVGSNSNNDVEPLPRASVQQANLDGSNGTTFAYGLRNTVGMAFHPVTNDLYVACQERDTLGDDLVPDYMTRIQESDFFGWPYAYMSPNLTDPRYVVNGTSTNPALVAQTKTPDVLFQAHSAVLDMRFYTGTQFPVRYRNGAFAALHGSWNRNSGTGYKFVFIPFDSTTNRPTGAYEDFVQGFLTNPSGPNTFARPVGILVMKDGSLLFSEDGNNRLYRVQYNASATTTTTTTSGTATTSSGIQGFQASNHGIYIVSNFSFLLSLLTSSVLLLISY